MAASLHDGPGRPVLHRRMFIFDRRRNKSRKGIDNDKDEFERFLVNDLKKYDKENEQIYEQIIQKLTFYIHKINEDELEAFNNTSFN